MRSDTLNRQNDEMVRHSGRVASFSLSRDEGQIEPFGSKWIAMPLRQTDSISGSEYCIEYFIAHRLTLISSSSLICVLLYASVSKRWGAN